MASNFINMLIAPLYCGFSTFNPDGNYLQFFALCGIILSIVNTIKYFIIKLN